jgi:hypothetical protein
MLIAAIILALQAAQPQPPAPALFEGAKRALDAQLFDFPSARFQEVRANATVICGRVNAKNRMGAYAGWQRFVYVAMRDGEDRLYVDDDIVADTFCDDQTRFVRGDMSDRLRAR